MHMFSVDFFFHLAIAADLISRVRPEGKADNKVDIAYLYYLPFCMVFVSATTCTNAWCRYSSDLTSRSSKGRT